MSVDFQNDLLLLTCASGKQCARLLPLVYGKWQRLRLVVHSASSEKRLKEQYPDADVVSADMARAEDAQRILSGVTSVLYIGPSLASREAEMGFTMIDAAYQESKKGGLKHFIYSSVLHPRIRKLMNHDCKRYVEEYLVESGLNYTIIQPSHMLDAFPVQLLFQQEAPVFPAAFDPKITFSFTVLQDLAEAFVRVFEEREKHYLAEYTACSTGPTSYADVISTMSHEIGRPIKTKQMDYYEAAGTFQKRLFGDGGDPPRATRDALHRLLLYYNFYGIKGNPNVLEWLIGRKPTTIRDYLHQEVLKCQGS